MRHITFTKRSDVIPIGVKRAVILASTMGRAMRRPHTVLGIIAVDMLAIAPWAMHINCFADDSTTEDWSFLGSLTMVGIGVVHLFFSRGHQLIPGFLNQPRRFGVLGLNVD